MADVITTADQLTDEHIRQIAALALRHVLAGLVDHDRIEDALDRVADWQGVVRLPGTAVDLDDEDWLDVHVRVAELFKQHGNHAQIPGITTP